MITIAAISGKSALTMQIRLKSLAFRVAFV